MKIQDIFFGDNSIRKNGAVRDVQKISKPSASEDSSGTKEAGYVRSDAEVTAFKVETDFPPRIELVNQVRERIAQGDYDDRYIRSVAKRIIELPIVTDVIAEAEMNASEEGAERIDRVEEVREQAGQGHYDDPAVRRKIAENLIEALGLDFMAGE